MDRLGEGRAATFNLIHLRLRVQIGLAEAVMLLSELDYPSRLVHGSCDVPDVEVLGCVHDEELTQAVHKTGGTPCRL